MAAKLDLSRCARCGREAPDLNEGVGRYGDPEEVGWYIVRRGAYGSDVDGIACAACATDEEMQAAVRRAQQLRDQEGGD